MKRKLLYTFPSLLLFVTLSISITEERETKSKVPLWVMPHAFLSNKKDVQNQRERSPLTLVCPNRPANEIRLHDIGKLWSLVSNYGQYGDPMASLPSYDWPDSSRNHYLFEGALWVGTVVGAETLVSVVGPGDTIWQYEWTPSENSSWFVGPGRSEKDILSEFDDWCDLWNPSPIGIKVIQRALAWSTDDYDDFIAYEYKLWNRGDYGDLDSLYVSWVFDCDISGASGFNSYVDDLVDYDGWDGAETNTDEVDSITINPDGTFINAPDGYPDEYTIFGDEPDEWTINGDTLLVPRNTSFMYDGDNPSIPGDDTGENGLSAGYIGGRLIYAPSSPSDSIWIVGVDSLRIVRPFSHQWWKWDNIPLADGEKYQYMTATHVNSQGYHFLPNPATLGDSVEDYSFLLTAGPFSVQAGDTIELVFGGTLGQELNGAIDSVFQDTLWVPGLRHHTDRMLKYYYLGSTKSDPFHPSAPTEDVHWGVPPTGVENSETDVSISPRFTLSPSIPNPFHSQTMIRYQVPTVGPISLKIYDLAGRLVETLVDERQESGVYQVQWNGRTGILPVRSGIYFYRLKAGNYTEARKMTLLR